MAQSTQSLHRHNLPRSNPHLPNAIEHRDARAQQRGDLDGIHVCGNAHGGLGAQSCVLGVSALAADAIHQLIGAHLVQTAGAGTTGAVVAAVPGTADAVADVPFLLSRRDRDDRADEFVAEAGDLTGVWER